jgi:hypothetical protein
MLPASRWSREIVLRARQVKRISDRLERPGPNKEARRRMRRRRQRLLERLEEALQARQKTGKVVQALLGAQ